MKKIIYIMCLGAMSLISCSEEELGRPDSNLWEIAEIEQGEGAALNVGVDLFDLKIGEMKQYEIAEGNGDYKVSVLDSDIAKVSLQDKTITVKGLQQGVTEVIVSDKNFNYKSIKLNVYITDNLVVDKPEGMTISLPMGKPKSQTMSVIEGNGSYEVTVENDEYLSASVQDNNIIVTGLKEGQTNVLVKDGRGLSVVVPVTIETIDSPYSDEELAEFKKRTDKGFYNDWIPFTIITTKTTGPIMIDGTKWYFNNGMSGTSDTFRMAYGFSGMNNSEELILSFPSGEAVTNHRTLGKKENVTMKYFKRIDSENIRIDVKNVPANFEVIKVDSKKRLIWAIWSAQYGDALYYGKLIMPNYAE